MLREITNNRHTKHTVYTLAALCGLACINIFVTLVYIFSMQSNEVNYFNTVQGEVTRLKFYLIINLVAIVTILIFIWCIINKTYHKPNSSDSLDETMVTSLQDELERQKLMVNNLTNLYNNLMEHDNLKTEFFSNMSHELKTPLCVILGAIQLMEQRKPSAQFERRKSSKHLQTIKQNCYRLLRLINNILDITRADSGYIKVNMVNCNIVYLVEEITQSVTPYSEQKNLSLEFDTDIEEIISAVDVDKIERIILNLLSNAIKFTPDGGKVSVHVSSSDGKFIISVKDSGLGIPTDMQNKIFERFRQVNSSLTRQFEGSGIGLSIVKSFVELHGGTICVKSQENKGSEFIIEIPIKLCEADSDIEDCVHNDQSKIIEAINIEFSDIYSLAS
ncbi:MAG: HAMP domain-containing histidine kinase [Clostridia bacterium]|nr:HAMP domain-containing histidine kinase [Clostridia bacterium]